MGRRGDFARAGARPDGPPPPVDDGPEIDRTKVCPLLLRVFPKVGSHHDLTAYSPRGTHPPGEVQVYTWPDASLRELAELVQEVTPAARRPGARLDFALVYPGKDGKDVSRAIGCVPVPAARGRRGGGGDGGRTLRGAGFETGDYLDVAIL